jgi:hypothetical protein
MMCVLAEALHATRKMRKFARPVSGATIPEEFIREFKVDFLEERRRSIRVSNDKQ